MKRITLDIFDIEDYRSRAEEIMGKDYSTKSGNPDMQKKIDLEKLYHVQEGLETAIEYHRTILSFEMIHDLGETDWKFFKDKGVFEAITQADLGQLNILKKQGQLLRANATNTRHITNSPVWDHQLRVGAVIYNLACAKAQSKYNAHLPDDWENISPQTITSNIESMLDKIYIVPHVRAILYEGIRNKSRW